MGFGDDESIMDKDLALISKSKLEFLYTITPKMQDFVVHVNQTARVFSGNDAFLNAFGRELVEGRISIRLVNSHSCKNCEEIFGHWRGTNKKSPNAGLNEFFNEILYAWVEKAMIKEK